MREFGLLQDVLGGTYQYAHLTAVGRHVIADQLDYHRRNADALSRMNDLPHRFTNGCFMLALAILVVFFLSWPVGHRLWAGWAISLSASRTEIVHSVTFIAAFLPALAAALAGIRETEDFHGFAHRSARTVTALENRKLDFASAKRTVSLDDTNGVLVAAARVLTEDLAAWQSLYSVKRLNLPV